MVITPTDECPFINIFLAGTIDMGNSPDWQAEFIKHIDSDHVKICNPRCKKGEAPKLMKIWISRFVGRFTRF